MAWGRQAPVTLAQRQLLPAGRSNEIAGRPNHEPSDDSRDDVSKEITTPTGTAVARPGAGPGLHPETKCSGVVTRKWRPQQGSDT
jgi:hypothetical protein